MRDGPAETQTVFHQMADSEWFERGWTLQELIAPKKVEFLDSAWRVFTTKEKALDTLVSNTGISQHCLEKPDLTLREPVAVRLSWAAYRDTSRSEDLAYCLLGLLDVNMPLLYGEGPKSAFRRLMSEVVGSSSDDSVFAHDLANSSIIADSAQAFRHCGTIRDGCDETLPPRSCMTVIDAARAPRLHTRMGLQRPVAFIPMKDFYRVMALDCHEENPRAPVLILLQNIHRGMRDMGENWTIQSSSSREGELVLEKASRKIREAIFQNRKPFQVETMILR